MTARKLCGARYDDRNDPCGKNAGHEIADGPDTDWKRSYHSNGQWKWRTGDKQGLTPADLHTFAVTVPMATTGHTRTTTVRIPATDHEAAVTAAGQIGIALSEASGHVWKLASDRTARVVGTSIHDPADDRQTYPTETPHLDVVLDAGNCVVLRYPGGSATITDVKALMAALGAALVGQKIGDDR